MAQQFPDISPALARFIAAQPVFFTATATGTSRVNVSPREGAALRVPGPSAVVYLDQTGSGNETAAHLRADGRMTVMFCAFSGPPRILRLYGRGRVIHRDSSEFADLLQRDYAGALPPGARQMVWLDIDLVQTSCGYGVPLLEPVGERSVLRDWAAQKTPEDLSAYWEAKNLTSIDGLPTGLLDAPEA